MNHPTTTTDGLFGPSTEIKSESETIGFEFPMNPEVKIRLSTEVQMESATESECSSPNDRKFGPPTKDEYVNTIHLEPNENMINMVH
jgi:hypothetical protein